MTVTNGHAAAPSDVISRNYAAGTPTHILSLTFPDLSAVSAADLTTLTYGIDAWELRADVLAQQTPEFVAAQIAVLRETAAELPILFTAPGADARDLVQAALDAGVEYIDAPVVGLKTGAAKVVASFHDESGALRWSSAEAEEKFETLAALGDIVKITKRTTSPADNHELALFAAAHTSKPFIGLNTGAAGQLSRILSPITYITHPLLPPSPLLSLAQTNTARHLHGTLPKRQFYIFGNNISHSLSPVLHNTGFAHLGLPHHYRIHETVAVDDAVVALMTQPNFGGASVTFPHKLQIPKHLSAISPEATLIGAVNTVVVGPDGTLRGDNTDWLGIRSCIEAGWPSGGPVDAAAAVVIGAGGASRAACYAAQMLGVKTLYLVNRTLSKAEDLARDFPALDFRIFGSLAALRDAGALEPVPRIIVGCIPADDLTEADIPANLFDGATDGGVLIEMAYRPMVTALMKVAGRHAGWYTARGTDVLKEQAYHQFRMWTGRRAPAAVMARAMEEAAKSH
ncbi:hypothetical protein EDC01DRAFT_744127 [Geopyxis carbonaria]|nr:hypothetical protein EDC01DRAFT_744127 [Geopyxis carbonaria]